MNSWRPKSVHLHRFSTTSLGKGSAFVGKSLSDGLEDYKESEPPHSACRQRSGDAVQGLQLALLVKFVHCWTKATPWVLRPSRAPVCVTHVDQFLDLCQEEQESSSSSCELLRVCLRSLAAINIALFSDFQAWDSSTLIPVLPSLLWRWEVREGRLIPTASPSWVASL